MRCILNLNLDIFLKNISAPRGAARAIARRRVQHSHQAPRRRRYCWHASVSQVKHVDMAVCGIRTLTVFSLATLASAIGISANVVAQTPVHKGTHGLAAAVHNSSCHAADVARRAAELCGALPIDEALLAVTTMPTAAARAGARVLAKLGFASALDLQLLGGGAAAAEVLAELKAGGMSAADRAKVRLLVGDQDHLRRLSSSPSWALAAGAEGRSRSSRNSDCGSCPCHGDQKGGSADERDWTLRNTRRKLQGDDASSSSSMSADTIAIALSVLVGAAGYVVQAHTARRAERAQQQQAQELHTAEQARQREHQMMTAQIERTHRGLDQCCRPALNSLSAILHARHAMVLQIVGRLQEGHPDVVEEMLSLANGVIYELQTAGTVIASSGTLRWAPNLPSELTRAMDDHQFAAPTGAACVIAGHDSFAVVSKPYCFEMPIAILDLIVAEPTGKIAEIFRSYSRHTLMPLLRRVMDTLQEHAAYLELPTKEWLKGVFPHMSWGTFDNAIFVQQWYAYTLSFERVLSEWSDSNFGSVRPAHPQPQGGMMRTVSRSQEQAETRQAELIGMTSVTEIDYGGVYGRFTSS
eukprot:SAG31_NODE_14_length_37953_cov_109.719660_19_plen_583_part_00